MPNRQAPGTPSEEGSSPATGNPRSVRTRRTLLACQRCKSRKQKCNGARPACSTCSSTSSECVYVPSTAPKPTEQKVLIKALKERVSELEKSLTLAEGLGGTRDQGRMGRSGEIVETPLSKTIRILSLNASGYSYLGASSQITIAHLLAPIVHSPGSPPSQPPAEADETSVDPLVTRNYPHLDVHESDILFLADPAADSLFEAYMDKVCHQYPIIQSKKLREMHSRRNKPKDIYEVGLLHLVYAIGGITLELSGVKGDHHAVEHYEAAMTHRSKIIRCIDRPAIRFFALAAVFCLRAPRNPGPWTMIGLAIKFSISLGLHRRSCTSKFGIRSEIDKRLFWTCYHLDREINLTMGRPPSICDHDIDTLLPLDVDEDSLQPEAFRAAMRQSPDLPANPPTTLTYFIHTLRLKRIVSKIQHTIYRVDTASIDSRHEEEFLRRLQDWKDNIPPSDSDNWSPDFEDSLMIQYNTCLRFLIFPRLAQEVVQPHFISIGFESCAAICKSFKRAHQRCLSTCYTPISIMTLFLAGLTVLYCMWRFPDNISQSTAHASLTDCELMLYIMTERRHSVEKHRKAFESLKTAIIEGIANQSRNNTDWTSDSNHVSAGEVNVRATLNSFYHDFGRNVFSNIFTEYLDGPNFSTAEAWDTGRFETGVEDDAHAFDDTEIYDFDPRCDLSFLDSAGGNYAGLFGL